LETVRLLLDWILERCFHFDELVADAKDLKNKAKRRLDMREVREVVAAMSRTSGYDYGGSASAHWYECPNGHPYYIGECGGAMETVICPECREPVLGGTSHNLMGTNRQAGGRILEAFR
jgi:hypothetical protein